MLPIHSEYAVVKECGCAHYTTIGMTHVKGIFRLLGQLLSSCGQVQWELVCSLESLTVGFSRCLGSIALGSLLPTFRVLGPSYFRACEPIPVTKLSLY